MDACEKSFECMEIYLTESSNSLCIGVGICLHIVASSFALGVTNLHNAMDLELDVVTQGAQVGTYQCWLGIGF
jgi:hypothetical protein